MDEDFASFLAELGPTIYKRYVQPSTIDRYRGKLPDHCWRTGKNMASVDMRMDYSGS